MRYLILLLLVLCLGCTKEEGSSSPMPQSTPIEISSEQQQDESQRTDVLPPRVDPTDPNVIRPADPHP
jgi:hypothetical protein